MNTEQLANTLETRAWARLYKDRFYSEPVAMAQDQLTGRTHYVDPDSLRFHHARVLRARVICSGLFLRIVESCAADYENTKRVFRFVVFDVWGNVVERQNFDNSYSSTDKALKGFDEWLADFDPIEYYRGNLAERVKLAQKEAERLGGALEEIESFQPETA